MCVAFIFSEVMKIALSFILAEGFFETFWSSLKEKLEEWCHSKHPYFRQNSRGLEGQKIKTKIHAQR